jgi:hypothetical protein
MSTSYQLHLATCQRARSGQRAGSGQKTESGQQAELVKLVFKQLLINYNVIKIL